MRLVSAEIKAFGRLSEQKITFTEGVNVLCRPNGFGKSTLANFIRAMLYGFAYTRKNGVSDASHWQPWGSDGRFGGSLTVQHNGETYRIERFFGATARAESLHVFNEKSGEDMFWQCPGEELLGINAESFDRSAYYPQEAVELASNSGLEQRLANLVQNSAEDYDSVQEKLRAYRKNLRYERGNGGLIYDVQQKEYRLEEQLKEVDSAKRRKVAIDDRLRQIEGQQQGIAAERQTLRNREAQLVQQLAQAQTSDDDVAARLRQVEEEIACVPPQLEQDADKCDELARKIAALPAENTAPRGKLSTVRWAIAALFAAVGAVMAVLGATGVLSLAVGLGTFAACAVAAAAVLLAKKPSKPQQEPSEGQTLKEEFLSLARRYVYFDGDDVAQINRLLWEKCNNYRSMLQLREALRPMLKPKTDVTAAEEELAGTKEKIARLEAQNGDLLREQGQLAEEQARLNTDGVAVQDELLYVREQQRQAQYRYKVAQTVSDMLAQAKQKLSVSYLPQLCNRTTELLQTVTCGSKASPSP